MTDQLVDIDQFIVHGVMFDPKNTQAWQKVDFAENIHRSVPKLFDLLEERGVEYVLVGGIAMLAYVDGRNTQDIDLIVAPADLDRLPEIRIEDFDQEFARGWFGDLRVDFLFTKQKLFEAIRKHHATKKQFADRRVTCATVDGLLMMKLLALPERYRRGKLDKAWQFETDAAGLIDRFQPNMASLLEELSKHMLTSDVEEIRRIVAEIEDRIAKQSQRFGPAAE